MPLRKAPRRARRPRRIRRLKKKRRMIAKANRRIWGSALTTAPLPPTFKTTLKYQDYVQISPGLAAADTKIFAANGLFDVDISGVGHQPLGFDQMMAFYNQYVVLASSIIVRFINNDATNSIICGVCPLNSTITISDSRRFMERNSKVAMLTKSGGGKDYATMKYNLNPNKFMGYSKPMSDDTLRGTSSANPATLCAYHVWAQAFDLSSDPGNVQAEVTIQYTAVFIRNTDLTLS